MVIIDNYFLIFKKLVLYLLLYLKILNFKTHEHINQTLSI